MPTVTDADVVLGYSTPTTSSAARMKLDREARAAQPSQRVADAARPGARSRRPRGIAAIAEFKMADIIRKMTDREGLRSARLRAVRVRRRRAGARRRVRARTRRAEGDRAAAARSPPPGARSARPRPTSCTSTSRSTSRPRPSTRRASTRCSASCSEQGRGADGRGRHRGRARRFCVLARHAAPRARSTRSRCVLAGGAPEGRRSRTLRRALLRALRAALRPRLSLPRRAAGDRDLPRARQRGDAAARAAAAARADGRDRARGARPASARSTGPT